MARNLGDPKQPSVTIHFFLHGVRQKNSCFSFHVKYSFEFFTSSDPAVYHIFIMVLPDAKFPMCMLNRKTFPVES